MIGAIIGDIVGSIYEWNNIKTKDFPLFSPGCFFTDDTVMTLAIAEGLISGGSAEDFIAAIKKYGRLYPDSGYGGRFGSWLFSDDINPYNSWGNGSAMRVSPVAWAFDILSEAEKYAEISLEENATERIAAVDEQIKALQHELLATASIKNSGDELGMGD